MLDFAVELVLSVLCGFAALVCGLALFDVRDLGFVKMSSDWIPIAGGVGGGVALFLSLYLIRRYIKGPHFKEHVDATGMVALVTGANSGIGKQLCRELGSRGARVYMLCRSVKRGEKARDELLSKYNIDPARLLVRELDLCSFGSVRSFVRDFDKEETKVDVLLCNAGVMWIEKFEKTVDGYETTLQANHLGHFLLTELLMPKLDASPTGGRVVLVSSKLHELADGCKVSQMNDPASYGINSSYARSKLANVLHAVELSKRLRARGSRVAVNALHPGVVNTGLIRNPIYTKCLKYPLAPIVWYIFKTEKDGAQCPLHVALSQKINGVSGEYFSDLKLAQKHRLASNPELTAQFYDDSLKAVGL